MPSERETLFATLIGQARGGDDAAWGKILASYGAAAQAAGAAFASAGRPAQGVAI